MPKLEGDLVIVKLEVGEKEDAKKVRPIFYTSLFRLSYLPYHFDVASTS